MVESVYQWLGMVEKSTIIIMNQRTYIYRNRYILQTIYLDYKNVIITDR